MSSVIDVLERMGTDSQLRHATQSELERVLVAARIEPELQAAILAQNAPMIGQLLAQETHCAFLFPAEEGEEEGDEEAPSKDDEEVSRYTAPQTSGTAG